MAKSLFIKLYIAMAGLVFSCTPFELERKNLLLGLNASANSKEISFQGSLADVEPGKVIMDHGFCFSAETLSPIVTKDTLTTKSLGRREKPGEFSTRILIDPFTETVFSQLQINIYWRAYAVIAPSTDTTLKDTLYSKLLTLSFNKPESNIFITFTQPKDTAIIIGGEYKGDIPSQDSIIFGYVITDDPNIVPREAEVRGLLGPFTGNSSTSPLVFRGVITGLKPRTTYRIWLFYQIAKQEPVISLPVKVSTLP